MSPSLLESASALQPAEGAGEAGFRPGDVATLVVRVSWEGEGSVSFPSREDLETALAGKARVLDEGADAPGGAAPLHASAGASEASRAWLVQLLLPPGEHELPDIPLELVAADGGSPQEVAALGPTVSIQTVLDEADAAQLDQAQAAEQLRAEVAQQLAPARGPWELAPILPWWALLLAALALLALAFWAFMRWWRKRRKAAPSVPRIVEPAEVVARRRLRELREGALLTTGRHLEFHVALADILKEYLERRLGTDLRERTTEEIRRLFHSSLRSARQVPEIRQEVLAVLNGCDLVKFARALPLPSEALAHVDAVERIITKTTEIAPAAPAVPGASDGKEAA